MSSFERFKEKLYLSCSGIYLDRITSILISVLIALLVYVGFMVALQSRRTREYFSRHWYYHPNFICVWRVPIGLVGILLYFLFHQHFLGILLFSVSAVSDGIDGLLARSLDLITPVGEEIDPLCDKLTYLPAMLFFAYHGRLDIDLVWIFVAIEAIGQFIVRYVLKRFTNFSVGANNFGKIKAVLCFTLIIYCAVLEDTVRLPNFTTQMLMTCILLSIASSVFKAIPNRFYGDILSLLNLSCGLISIYYIFDRRFVWASIAILAGQVFDLFDGRMAEKHGGTKLGPYLDDIADLVSFGLCPGLLILVKNKMGLSSVLIGAIYFLAVAYRLWRYLQHDKNDPALAPGIFNGLPSPAGAMVAMGACLFWKDPRIIGLIILLTSFLLVSHIRFIHFGRVILRRTPRPLVVIFGFIIVFLSAYLIKVKSAETLGILLLFSFAIYLILGNNRIAGKLFFRNET